MVLKPTYYLADFMTGRMLATLPLESVSLSSSLQPGQFSASLNMRRACQTLAEARELRALMANGKTTLVPVLEGMSGGTANPLTSREMGEWWIRDIGATYTDPVIKLSGPEWIGYSKEILVTETWEGRMDGGLVLRDMLREMARTDQTVQLTLGSWLSGTLVDVDVQKSTKDYWAAISSLQDADTASTFEWRVATSLQLDGIVPLAVGRTLVTGAPVLRAPRVDIVLELMSPGTGPASLTDMSRSESQGAAASTVYGFGAGSGDDQIHAYTSRSREPGEPGKSRLITVKDALTYDQLKRHTNAELSRQVPEDKVFSVTMPTDRYTPRVTEEYGWKREPSWSMPDAEDGTRRCVGWSWKSTGADVYTLDLVEA